MIVHDLSSNLDSSVQRALLSRLDDDCSYCHCCWSAFYWQNLAWKYTQSLCTHCRYWADARCASSHLHTNCQILIYYYARSCYWSCDCELMQLTSNFVDQRIWHLFFSLFLQNILRFWDGNQVHLSHLDFYVVAYALSFQLFAYHNSSKYPLFFKSSKSHLCLSEGGMWLDRSHDAAAQISPHAKWSLSALFARCLSSKVSRRSWDPRVWVASLTLNFYLCLRLVGGQTIISLVSTVCKGAHGQEPLKLNAVEPIFVSFVRLSSLMHYWFGVYHRGVHLKSWGSDRHLFTTFGSSHWKVLSLCRSTRLQQIGHSWYLTRCVANNCGFCFPVRGTVLESSFQNQIYVFLAWLVKCSVWFIRPKVSPNPSLAHAFDWIRWQGGWGRHPQESK